jgi:hypothetical protein
LLSFSFLAVDLSWADAEELDDEVEIDEVDEAVLESSFCRASSATLAALTT